MFANQRQSLLGGAASPSFSREDAVLAAEMGITLSPTDVLATKRAVVDRMTQPTEVMLATLRGEAEARQRAEKRATQAEHQVTELLRGQYQLKRAADLAVGFAWFSVPFLAIETAIILWMAWRLWAQ